MVNTRKKHVLGQTNQLCWIHSIRSFTIHLTKIACKMTYTCHLDWAQNRKAKQIGPISDRTERENFQYSRGVGHTRTCWISYLKNKNMFKRRYTFKNKNSVCHQNQYYDYNLPPLPLSNTRCTKSQFPKTLKLSTWILLYRSGNLFSRY